MNTSKNPMPEQNGEPRRLTDAFPAFADELRQLLVEKGEPELAAQVSGLRIFDLCGCGDDICSTFYTRPQPEGSFGPSLRNVRLFPPDGALLILDVVDGRIVCIELLDRPEVRETLLVVVL